MMGGGQIYIEVNTATDLSRAMAHRLRMDAVQHSTSAVNQILQVIEPNTHFPSTEYATFRGRTVTATYSEG